MRNDPVPQPSLERMVPFAGHPVLCGVVPDQDPLVVRTAVALVAALGAPLLQLAYVDPSRYVVEEGADVGVRHAALDPDVDDDGWQALREQLTEQVRAVVADEVPWQLGYLAGRPDRSLTHLARAIDAAVIVVGSRPPGPGARMKELVEGSVAAHLTHHQHRPVLTVPLGVVDWKELRAPWQG